MRALTVQQPWAWAIVHGGKDVENRTQAWTYRGPLAIHAGARWSQRGDQSPLIARAMVERAAFEVRSALGEEMGPLAKDVIADELTRSSLAGAMGFFVPAAILGVVDLIDVHTAEPEHIGADGLRVDFCCDSPWAESSYAEHGGSTRRDVVHLVLELPRPLEQPIPARGRLGLWAPDAELLAQIREQVPT